MYFCMYICNNRNESFMLYITYSVVIKKVTGVDLTCMLVKIFEHYCSVTWQVSNFSVFLCAYMTFYPIS